MKKICLLLCLILSFQTAYGALPEHKKIHKGLNRLEKRVFNRVYADDLPANRISRLEEQVFGTIQSGDLNDRYGMLKRAVPGNFTHCSGLANSLGNFFTNFGGYPTGMTPQIYMPGNFGSDYYSNHGWAYNHSNVGSGTGVHILD